jgi:L-ascorbate metabolism protein UlaG (beta-lactamase superfamily)
MAFTLTWYGHAALGLETGGCRLLVDPYFTGNPAASAAADQVDADYILVSHGHNDHLGDTIPIARRTGAKVICNVEIADWLEKQGLPTLPQQVGGGASYPFGYLKLTQAVHGSGLPDGSYGGNPAGFLLTTLDREKIYLACDTGLFGDMRLIGGEGLTLAVLPIGDTYTMGPADALQAVELLQPRHVIPIHYNTWEKITQDPHVWRQRVEAQTSALVHVLQPGESFRI